MVKKKRGVCQIISSFYPLIGGAERATQALAEGLARAEWHVQIVTTWYPGLVRHEKIGNVSVRRVGWSGPVKLRSLLFGFSSIAYVLLKHRSTPLLHAQNIDTPVLVGVILKIITRKKLILTVNSDKVVPGKQRTFLGRLRIALIRQWVDHFIAVSSSGRKGMLDAGIPVERISLIPNGLDTEFFRLPTSDEKTALRAKFGYDSQDIVLLFLGRLIPSKRADLVISALDKLRADNRIKCLIVGEGSEKAALQVLTQKLDLQDRVHFTGGVNNVRDFYWLSDIFVQPSQFEGLSVALLESMACGLAVVVSNCDGNLELVTNRLNGLTFPIDDEQQLIERLVELIENTGIRTELSASASRDIKSKHGKETVTQAHLEVYQRVLKKGTYCSDGSRSASTHQG